MARLSTERWAEIVAEAETAGISQAAVAARHRVSVSALRYQVYKARGARGNGAPRLLPVRVSEERLTLQAQCGVIRLAFPEGCDPAYVASILAALSKLTC